VLALPGGSPADRLPALDAAGGIAYWQGDLMGAREHYNREAALAKELGDERGLAEARYNESFTFSLHPGEYAEARRLAQDALDRFRRLGDRAGEGKALWGVVNSYIFTDEKTQTLPLVEEAIGISRELGDRFQLGWGLFTRGLIHTQRGEQGPALDSYRQALEIFRQTEDVTGYALVIDGIAALHWLAGNEDVAMRLTGAATRITDLSGIGLAKINRDAAQFFPQDLLERAELAGEYAVGQQMSTEEALELAMASEMDPAPS
jgi:tetratricopeptide (TPR) repeat protein